MKRRRCERGFFIVWGSKNRATNDGGTVEAQCPKCRERTVLQGKVMRRWFTLYFCPIFPTGEGQRFTECTRCGGQFRGTIEEFRAMAGRAGGGAGVASFEGAIALFNEMRETPTDSGKLLRLMGMYEQLGAPEEIVSAGRAYAAAAEGSDACMGKMAKAYQAMGDRGSALKWATAALALNPGNVEAQGVQGVAIGSGVGVGNGQ